MRQSAVSAAVVSVIVHAAILVPLVLIPVIANTGPVKLMLETVFEEERPTEEFTRELNMDVTVSETTNTQAGAPVVSAVSAGSGGPPAAQRRIENSTNFKDAEVAVNLNSVDLPGMDVIGKDLGEGMVMGDVSAPVEGYGAALGRVTQELLRMMREQRVLVVWLFDESDSMKDDRDRINEQFHKVYEELGIQQEKDASLKKKGAEEVLLTAIHSFGIKVNKLTPQPTGSITEVRRAIDKVSIDESGKENTCTAISSVIDEYRSMKNKTKRKLVIIVVTDESGDDGAQIDDTIKKARGAEAPVYVLGREAVFGYPYARLRWQDPKYMLTHWLQINRGPETAYFEAMQWDGLHGRWDAHPSGFGPYEQARLCKETGGIFFILPHEEQELVGQAAVDKRKFDFLDLKEYVPQLISRPDYLNERNASKFRSTVVNVAIAFNPAAPGQGWLNMQQHWFPAAEAEFKKAGLANFTNATRARLQLTEAIKQLEAVRPLRDKEKSARWRANYDLIIAQCKAYSVMLFQYQLVMDKHVTPYQMPKNLKNNTWNFDRTQKMVEPDKRQIELTKVNLDELKKYEAEARRELEAVKTNHRGTPWANRAEWELNTGFGWYVHEEFRDPRYDNVGREIKLPSP